MGDYGCRGGEVVWAGITGATLILSITWQGDTWPWSADGGMVMGGGKLRR
jgi:hypothetical protein